MPPGWQLGLDRPSCKSCGRDLTQLTYKSHKTVHPNAGNAPVCIQTSISVDSVSFTKWNHKKYQTLYHSEMIAVVSTTAGLRDFEKRIALPCHPLKNT